MPGILVVDDEPEIRNFLRLLLEGEGYRVRVAHDGQEGATLAESDPPDLVLTDWAMPRLGGDGLCALLRGSDRTRQIPIILMSAVTSSASADYSAFLSKPFDLEELLRVIRGCLNERGLNGPTSRAAARAGTESGSEDVAASRPGA